jgi:hypothetical protein
VWRNNWRRASDGTQFPERGGVGEDLAAQKRRLENERSELATQQAAWQSTQDRLTDLATYCERVAGNLETMAYAEKRELLLALDVKVLLYRSDCSPRWEFSADFDDIVDRTVPVLTASVRARRSCCGGPAMT